MSKIASTYNLEFNKGVWNRFELIQSKDECGSFVVDDIPAIYCLFSTKRIKPEGRPEISRLLYIGKTKNLRTRLMQHLYPTIKDKDTGKEKKNYDYLHDDSGIPDSECFYSYAKLSANSLDKCEAGLINKFTPPLNKSRNTSTMGNHGPCEFHVSGDCAYTPIKGDYKVSDDN